MVSASELRVCLQSQYGPSARTSSSSTGLRPVPPVRTDPVRIKYSPRGLRSRDHWFSSCVLWWAPDRAGDAQDWQRQRWHCWWVCGVGVSASFLLCSFFLVSFRGRPLLDGFLAMADAGVELAAPAPRVEAVLLSSPPFLTLLTSTSLDAGLSSTELITCCAVEYVRGGVQGGVAFVTRPLGWSWSQP